MSTLSDHLVAIAKTLMSQSAIVRWTDVITALEHEGTLPDAERKEAENVGMRRLAKQAVKAAVPDNTLFDWASGSLATPSGARVPRGSADIATYDWLIAQVDRTIANCMRYRDRLVAERNALVDQSGDRA
jgi:hypothetical protein